MADFENNQNEEIEELGEIIYTLISSLLHRLLSTTFSIMLLFPQTIPSARSIAFFV